MRKGRKKKTILFLLLSLLAVSFIFWNSTRSVSFSGMESGLFVRIIKPLFDPKDHIRYELFDTGVRKLAHFVEFAVFGYCLSVFFRGIRWKKPWQSIVVPLLTLLTAGAVDEVIQIFSVSRGPSVQDVLLDCVGGIFGIACAKAVHAYRKRKENAVKNQSL